MKKESPVKKGLYRSEFEHDNCGIFKIDDHDEKKSAIEQNDRWMLTAED